MKLMRKLEKGNGFGLKDIIIKYLKKNFDFFFNLFCNCGYYVIQEVCLYNIFI